MGNSSRSSFNHNSRLCYPDRYHFHTVDDSYTLRQYPPSPVEILAAEYGVDVPSEAIRTLGSWKTQGKSIVLFATRIIPDSQSPQSEPWSLFAIFAASDPLRPEASAVIEALQQRGIDVWMLSGDNPTTACAVGA